MQELMKQLMMVVIFFWMMDSLQCEWHKSWTGKRSRKAGWDWCFSRALYSIYRLPWACGDTATCQSYFQKSFLLDPGSLTLQCTCLAFVYSVACFPRQVWLVNISAAHETRSMPGTDGGQSPWRRKPVAQTLWQRPRGTLRIRIYPATGGYESFPSWLPPLQDQQVCLLLRNRNVLTAT